MEFVTITNSTNPRTNELLSAACQQRKISYRELDADRHSTTELPPLAPGTLLYRVATGIRPATMERMLLRSNIVTLYRDPLYLRNDRYATLTLFHAGIPMPRTIFSPLRQSIDADVRYLGGYPVIIKIIGGSHGIGVLRADSRESLLSFMDYLDQEEMYYILRSYIHVPNSARLIVLGAQVIDSIEYQVPEGDFRSNVGEAPKVQPKKFDATLERSAVAAVQALGLEFGGVDILYDTQSHYVVEVNFPCYFGRAQDATGFNTAGAVIDYLKAKAEKNGYLET
ncbi:MAG: ATP-grasp domain-containing protein [Candidatus Kerfeldbacteria bacterium]|nr:ATP-grasp domain-containing protein [Candidatus Kerfeldbacteria bacterium]